MASLQRHLPAWMTTMLWFRRECPRCNSVQFKQAEQRWFDRFLGYCAIRPVRCMFCWRRFYWFALHSA